MIEIWPDYLLKIVDKNDGEISVLKFLIKKTCKFKKTPVEKRFFFLENSQAFFLSLKTFGWKFDIFMKAFFHPKLLSLLFWILKLFALSFDSLKTLKPLLEALLLCNFERKSLNLLSTHTHKSLCDNFKNLTCSSFGTNRLWKLFYINLLFSLNSHTNFEWNAIWMKYF